MAALTPVPKIQFFDANGNPLVGGKLYSYDAGTTTPRSTYTNYGGGTANANPVILDSRGEANVWLDSSLYKLKLTSATDVEIWTVDNIGGPDQATLAQLATSGGSALVGFIQAGTGATARTVQAKIRERVSVKDFGAVGDGVADDTAAIQAAFTYGVTITQAAQVTVNGVLSSLVSAAPEIYFPIGRYRISSAINAPSYLYAKGEQAEILQSDLTKDILYCLTAVRWHVDGITFIGGRHHAYIGNPNTDVTLYLFENCDFVLSQGYAIKTEAQGGVWTHMSANLTIRKCIFDRPNKVLDNCCDSAVIDDSWVFVDKLNFAANSAAIRNRGDTGRPQLYLKNFFGVPTMGTGGTRLAGVRWIDNYVGAVIATNTRFGGEDAGMPPVYQMAATPTAYPWFGAEVTIRDSWTFAGESSSGTSGVLVLIGGVPQKITIENNLGPLDVPFVINPVPLPGNYFTTWESASGQKAYNYFKFHIRHNETTGPDGSLGLNRLPFFMRPYVDGSALTQVSLAAPQTIVNGFVSNPVSFTTVDSDTFGAWEVGNPTRLTMPASATKMRITLQARIGTHATSEIIKISIKTSGGTIVAANSSVLGINADDNIYSLSVEVSGAASQYWYVDVQTNAAANLSLASCVATMTPLDLVT
jgi:hypothetical protein